MELRLKTDKEFRYKMKCVFHLVYGREPETEEKLITFASSVNI